MHTLKAYRQDFDAIAALVAGDTPDLVRLPLAIIGTEAMRSAFADYARSHEATSIRRCWSTWNVLCTFLFTAEMIPANPMPMIGRPKQPKSLPKSLPADAVTALLAAVSTGPQRPRSTDWLERDRALIITGLLAGLRADELVRANIGDLRRTETAPSFRSAARATKTAASPSKPSSSTSSSTTSTAERPDSPTPLVAPPPPGDWPAGPASRRCSSVATANASPAAPCSIAYYAPSGRPGSTAPARKVLCYMVFGIPSPPNWPTQMSASTS